jgi:TonB family protein
MATGSQSRDWNGPSRRRVPRFQTEAPLDVTVLRSGIPDTVPGRSMNVCERGIAASVAGELVPGETVGVEVQLSPATEPLRTRATVRYSDQLRCGLEFAAMSAEQRAAIRDWAKGAKAEAETETVTAAPTIVDRMSKKEIEAISERSSFAGGSPAKRRRKRRSWWWLVAVILISFAAGVLWWKWNRGWEEIEAGQKNSETATADKTHVQVSAEVMQKLLVHRVEPVYPPEARKDNVQGIIALDIVVSPDGSVVSMKPLNGPDVLANAAMDALRWWKFDPYRVNGEPTAVETTVAVEFKK